MDKSTIKGQRNSSIELLKIVAMIGIVICHVSATFGSPHPFLHWDGFLNYKTPSADPQQIFMNLLVHLGHFGNNIFFICSAWFLCDEPEGKTYWRKIINLICDVWLISVVILIIFFLSGENISNTNIIKSIFPNTFANNWYVTCYIMVLAIHPLLNTILNKTSQKQLLSFCVISFGLYYCISFIYRGAFFVNRFVIFISLYFIVAYVKKYLLPSLRREIILFFSGAIGQILITIAINLVGSRVLPDSSIGLYWEDLSSPFLMVSAFGLFGIFKKKTFVNKGINYISGLMLYVYLIHENLLVGEYFRPKVAKTIIQDYSYSHLAIFAIGGDCPKTQGRNKVQ